MSFLAIAYPVQAAAQTAVTYARPLLGLGVLVTLFIIFKPMLLGVVRAAWLAVKPRRSLEQRNTRSKLQGVLMLNRMARELDCTQPSLAAELRLLASRG